MSFQAWLQNEFQTRLPKAGAPERAFREKAWHAFETLGLPARGHEAWKYSSLQSLTQPEWHRPTAQELPAAVREITEQFRDEFDIAVLLNGVWSAEASQLGEGYRFEPRADYASPLNFDDGFLSAAAAIHAGGFTLGLEAGAHPRRPLLIVHATSGDGVWTSTLNDLHLGAGAALQLAEVFVGRGAGYLSTDVTRVRVDEGAVLEWVRAQQEGDTASAFAEVQAHVALSARVALTQVNCGGRWSRVSLKMDIQGEGAEVIVNGLSFGRGDQHVDQRVQVSHHAGHSASHQLFKGILKDRARGVLNGKIYIARDAQKVASSQLNHNLILGRGAEADTKPELEIYADDVKANHGASVGRLDEEKLFYLESRGIARAEAERMLARAFVADVLMKIPAAPLRALIAARVENLLPGFLAWSAEDA